MSFKEQFINKKNIAVIFLVLILGAVSTWYILGSDGLIEAERRCCADICEGFDGSCRGWRHDVLECYFEKGSVDEIRVFKITQEFKESVCGRMNEDGE